MKYTNSVFSFSFRFNQVLKITKINLGFLNLCLHNHFFCVCMFGIAYSLYFSVLKIGLICLNIIPSKYALEDLYASHNLVMLFFNFSSSPNVCLIMPKGPFFYMCTYAYICTHTLIVFANVATCVCSVLSDSKTAHYILGLKIFKALLLIHLCVGCMQ